MPVQCSAFSNRYSWVILTETNILLDKLFLFYYIQLSKVKEILIKYNVYFIFSL